MAKQGFKGSAGITKLSSLHCSTLNFARLASTGGLNFPVSAALSPV
jgi:hypothetical protein